MVFDTQENLLYFCNSPRLFIIQIFAWDIYTLIAKFISNHNKIYIDNITGCEI